MPLTFNSTVVPLHLDETGTVRVSGSRVTLDTVLGAYLRGETPEAITAGFPAVSTADVHAIISYYLRHRPEVDAYLERREQEARAIRAVIEADPDNQALRERLRARKAQLEAGPHAAADSR